MEPITYSSCACRARGVYRSSGSSVFIARGKPRSEWTNLRQISASKERDFIHAIERLEERTDKRFVEVNQQIIGLGLEMSQQITGLRSEMSQQITGLRSEMNQRISEVRDEIAGVRTEISKLNQNHIEHLTHHHNN